MNPTNTQGTVAILVVLLMQRHILSMPLLYALPYQCCVALLLLTCACLCSVQVVSDAFSGKCLVQRHKMVYSILDHELKTGVHALALKTKTPEEAAK